MRLLQRDPILSVLIWCAVAGALLGLSNASWQASVETGQVLAQHVIYPKDNPFYMYHIKVFSLINYISAILLKMLGSERIVCTLVSMLLGVVSFQAIGLLMYSLSRSTFFAVFGVLFIYFTNQIGDGVVYPIWLLGTEHTFGILGLGITLYIIGSIGAGMIRTGSFLLGLSFCVHPSLGLWINILFFIALVIYRNRLKEALPRVMVFYTVGFVVSIGCLLFQLHLMKDLPKIDAEVAKTYLYQFVKYWGCHRTPLYQSWESMEVMNGLGHIFCLMSILVAMVFYRKACEEKLLQIILAVIALNGILGLLLGILTHVSPEKLPTFLLILMPGRYINLNNVVLAPLLLGYLVRPDSRLSPNNYSIFLFYLVASFFSRHHEILMVVYLILLIYIMKDKRLSAESIKATLPPISDYKKMFVAFLVAFLFINAFSHRFVNNRLIDHINGLWDNTDDEFYAAAAQRTGMMLITGDCPRVQLKTKRPVLADMSAPNFSTYATESAVGFSRILKSIYGIDINVPPAPKYLHREMPSELYKELWEGRSLEEWQALKREFKLSDVQTDKDWQLHLPVLVRSGDYVLYTIP